MKKIGKAIARKFKNWNDRFTTTSKETEIQATNRQSLLNPERNSTTSVFSSL